jgi:hypothetical protein
MHVSQELLQSMRLGQVLFLREIGAFWLSHNYVGLSEGKSGWIHRQIHRAYDILDKSIQDQILIKDANGIPTGDVKVAIFPDTLVLLDKFRPAEWAAKIESILVVAVGEYRPVNMLWAQIIILDISIHYLVRGGWTQTDEEFQLWSKETIAVFNAVIDSWCPRFGKGASPSTNSSNPTGNPKADAASLSSTKATREKQEKEESKLEENGASKLDENDASKLQEKAAPESSTFTSTTKNDSEESTNNTPRKFAEWDLIGSLEKQTDLKLSEDPEKQKEKIRQLAEFLELRALLVIAFYMLSPDSSDVYAAERSEVEMPII